MSCHPAASVTPALSVNDVVLHACPSVLHPLTVHICLGKINVPRPGRNWSIMNLKAYTLSSALHSLCHTYPFKSFCLCILVVVKN